MLTPNEEYELRRENTFLRGAVLDWERVCDAQRTENRRLNDEVKALRRANTELGRRQSQEVS